MLCSKLPIVLTGIIFLACGPLVCGQEPDSLAVIPYNTPDPTAMEGMDGSGIYVFSTNPGITISRSTDMVDWTRLGVVFPEKIPAWAKAKIPGANAIWAPDIVRLNGQYYLYYSVSTFGSQRSVIGVATNRTLNPDSPDYQWIDRGMVLESDPRYTDYNAIDSALFVDSDGRAYLFWGSYWTGIKAVEIDATTGKPFAYQNLASENMAETDSKNSNANPNGDTDKNEKNSENEQNSLKIPADYRAIARREGTDTSIEAAYVIRRNDWYYLFTSRGSCCDGVKSTYHIVVGRAESPLGPYLDRDGKRLDAGGGTLLLESSERWKGTGHNAVFQTTDANGSYDWLILAAYDATTPKKGRLTQIRPLIWQDGWPVAGDIVETPRPSER